MADIDKIISEYSPGQAGVEALRATPLVLLVGVTGAGKNTVIKKMVETGQYHCLVTTVTREPRYNNGVLERDGVEYYFVTEAEALRMLAAGEYLEVSPVHGRIYGMTVSEIQKAGHDGKIAIADVDVQGVNKIKHLSDNVTAIFLVPPSYQEWQSRIRHRYKSEQEFLAEWPNRRASAVKELEKALAAPYYHFVINENLDEAVDACIKISHSNDAFVRKDDEIRLVARDLLEAIKSSV